MKSPGARRALWSVMDLLGSRAMSFWVIGAWAALTLLWLVPFQLTGQPGATIAGIASEWAPFRIAYAALLVTTLVCGIARLRRDLRRARSGASPERSFPTEDGTRSAGTLASAATVLAADGWRVAESDDRVVAARRRWSLLGGSVFHLSLPLLAAGLVVHAATYASITFRLVEGRESADSVTAIHSGRGSWRDLRAATRTLRLLSVSPRFYSDVMLFEGLDAVLLDTRNGRRLPLSLASPHWLDPFTMVSIQDFGFAPHVQALGPDGAVLEEAVSPIAVFPPGKQDVLQLERTGVAVSMVVYPDYGVVSGRDVSRTFNLREPRVLVGIERAFPAGMVRARKLVRLGEVVPDSDPPVLVKDIRYSGQFRVWRSHGWPLLALGAALLVAGLAARVLYPFEEITVWTLDDGALSIAARVDGRRGSGAGAARAAAVAARIAAASGSEAP